MQMNRNFCFCSFGSVEVYRFNMASMNECFFPTVKITPYCELRCMSSRGFSSIFEVEKRHWKSPLHDCSMLTDLCFFFSRDNATDAQVCSGLGTCLCGDCVCKKTGVSVISQYKKDRGACWKIWKKNLKRYKDPVLWVWLQIFVTWMVPIRKHHSTYCCLFLAQYPNRFRKSSQWTRKSFQNSAFNPWKVQRGDYTPSLFYGVVASVHVHVKYFWSSQGLASLSPFPLQKWERSRQVHFLFTAVIFFSFALVKLSTANTVNAATLIVLQTQTRTSYVAVRITVNFQPKQEKMKRSPT